MAYTCEIISTRENTDGSFEVTIREDRDGVIRDEGHTFGSKALMFERAANLSQSFDGVGLCIDVLMAYWLRRDSSLSNFNIVSGKRFIMDPDAAQPVRVI
jgi:hypothetical protein